MRVADGSVHNALALLPVICVVTFDPYAAGRRDRCVLTGLRVLFGDDPSLLHAWVRAAACYLCSQRLTSAQSWLGEHVASIGNTCMDMREENMKYSSEW